MKSVDVKLTTDEVREACAQYAMGKTTGNWSRATVELAVVVSVAAAGPMGLHGGWESVEAVVTLKEAQP